MLPFLLRHYARNRALCPKKLRFLFSELAVVGFLALAVPSLKGQVETLPSTGLSANSSYQSTDIDSVDLSSGNVNVHLPLISFPQLGNQLKLNFVVRYNQPQWNLSIYSDPTNGSQSTPTSFGGIWQLTQKQGTAPASGPLGVDVVRDQGITVRSEVLNYPCLAGGQLIDCAGGPSPTTPGNGGSVGASGNYYTTSESVYLRDRSGAVHPLIFSNVSGGDLSGIGSPIIISQDGSGWLPQGQNGSLAVFSVTDRQGLRYTPSSLSQNQFSRGGWDVTDTHGNRITTTDNGWTDSVGRNIPGTWIGGLPEDDPMPGVPASDASMCSGTTSFARTWSVPGKSQPYVFCYTKMSGTTAFNLQTMLGYPASGAENSWSAPFLTQIVLPNQTSYYFTYDPVFADLISITFPTGGYVKYAWQTISNICSYTNPRQRVVQSRTVSDGSYTYSTNYSWTPACQTPGTSVVVSKPDGNDEWHITSVFNAPQNTQQDTAIYYQGRSSVTTAGQAPQGTIKKQVLTTYSLFNSTLRTTNGTPETFRGPATSVVTTLDDGSVTETDYTLVPNGGLVTFDNPIANVPYQFPNGQTLQCYCINYPEIADVKVYDYGQGAHGALLQETTTHYQAFEGQSAPNYLAANLIDLPSEVDLFDGNGNQAAKSSYTYDESAYSPGNVQGDLTSVAKFIDSSHAVTMHTSFNGSGMPTQMTDARNTVTAINSYQCSGLFPQRVLLASGTPVQQSQSYVYDCNTGNPTSFTDANNQQTTYSYSDPLSRLTGASYPDGGSYSASYTDGSHSSVQMTTKTGGPQGNLVQTVQYDGLSRTINASTAGGGTVGTMYDPLGRVSATSNPGASGLTGSAWTSYAYDALGRPSFTCNSDNGTAAGQCSPGTSYQEWDYSGATTSQYDERRYLWTRTSDALGRLTGVSEPGGASTTYGYTVRGDLQSTTQLGVSGETPRTRTFTYDWLSRLLTASNPETGPMCYGLASGASCTSGYDGNGNLTAKTDARGITTNFVYDALNRLTQKNYSDGTPSQFFGYDGKNEFGNPIGGIWANNAIGRLSHTSDQALSVGSNYAYDTVGRLILKADCTSSDCSYNPQQAAVYDLAGNLTSLTYPDGTQISQQFDSAGRLSGVYQSTAAGLGTQYAGITYFADGTPNVTTYGNGVVETRSENDRLQTCGLRVTSGNNVPLDRSYSFNSSAPMPFCGEEANNNGNIWRITDNTATVGPFTQTMQYDSLNRIQSWDAPNLANAYRHLNFSYDSFGNMVSDRGYDPALGASPNTNVGTPSARPLPNPNYTSTSSSNWPYDSNNRLVSAAFDCTPPSGSSPYDLAGNMLCDGSASSLFGKQYMWDAESRISSINAQPGSANTYYLAAFYHYDAQGQRVRSDYNNPSNPNNSTWREYTFFNGMLLADKDNYGNWTDYIYAGGKKIARIENGTTTSGGGTTTPPTTTTPSVSGLHMQGTAIAARTHNGQWLLDLGNGSNAGQSLEGYVIQGGDKLTWLQYQSSTVQGGVAGVGFWDCGIFYNLPDTNNGVSSSGSIANAWETKTVDLSQWKGCTFQVMSVGPLDTTAAGSWNLWISQFSLQHADGTNIPIYTSTNHPDPQQYTPDDTNPNGYGFHMQGTMQQTGPNNGTWHLDLWDGTAPTLERYQVQQGDQLVWSQLQGYSVQGGLIDMFFWDCGDVGGLTDTAGHATNSGSVVGAWETKTLSLQSQVGCTFQDIRMGASQALNAGQWDFWIANVYLQHADGTTMPVYTLSQHPDPVSYVSDDPSTNQPRSGAYERYYPVYDEPLSAIYDTMQGSGSGSSTTTPASNSGSSTTSSGPVLTYTLTDHLGTAALEFDASGNLTWQGAFAPFGQEVDSSTTTNRFKFTGKERDTESGLDYFGARYYGSSMGRFMSPDPSGLMYADPGNPQSLNLYSYVLNNPLSYVDPTGMYCDYSDHNDAASVADPSQQDYHSSKSECTKKDENGNRGVWVNDAYTHNNQDDAGRPNDAVSSNSTPPAAGTNLTYDIEVAQAQQYLQTLATASANPTARQYLEAIAQATGDFPDVCSLGAQAGVGKGRASAGVSADTRNGVRPAASVGGASRSGAGVSATITGGPDGDVSYSVPVPATPFIVTVGTQGGSLNHITSVAVGRNFRYGSASVYANTGTVASCKHN